MKHLLFDFDGVIVNSWDACYDASMNEFPDDINPETFRRLFDGNVHGNHLMKKRAQNHDPSSKETEFFNVYIPKLMGTGPVEGIPEMLKAFSETMRLVIVTSSVTSPTEEYLRTYDLFEYFDDVYGADVHVSKQEKVKMVFDEFNTSAKDCLFITDTLGDMREAAMANVPVVGVTWGFQKTETLLKGNPIGVADTVEELTAMINAWAKDSYEGGR